MNGAATQIASGQFDEDFFRLPAQVRELVQKKLDAMSARLAAFPHFRMTPLEPSNEDIFVNRIKGELKKMTAA